MSQFLTNNGIQCVALAQHDEDQYEVSYQSASGVKFALVLDYSDPHNFRCTLKNTNEAIWALPVINAADLMSQIMGDAIHQIDTTFFPDEG